MPTGNGGPRPGQIRRDERFGFPVRVRVNGGHEPGAMPWEEETTTQDASAGGASFLVEHAVTVGDVVRLQVLPPLPETFGPFELSGPSPPVFGSSGGSPGELSMLSLFQQPPPHW